MLRHLTGLHEILGTLDDGEQLTEEQMELTYSDDGEAMKRAVLMRSTPRLVLYVEVAAITLLLCVVGQGTASAQTRGQRIADAASYATLGVNIAIDARQSWVAPDRGHRLTMLAVRLGVTGLLTSMLKDAFPRARPCAPACGIDSPLSDFPSGHTAFAFQALGHPTDGDDAYLAKLGIAALTGGLRMAAHKHDMLGVLGGTAIGLGASRLR